MNAVKNFACPTCQKKTDLAPTNPYRPFCSERCKLIDLGKWASEEYKIPIEHTENSGTLPDNSSENEE